MEKSSKHIALNIKRIIHSVDPEAEAILYGSRARGEERSGSDWDILVLTEKDADLNMERKFRHKLYDLELETGEVFSVFVYSKKDWETRHRISPFYQNVKEEGLLL